MTTRETLEQEFNDKFWKLFTKEQLENLELKHPYPQNEEIKSYIFEKMIPKVLEEIVQNAEWIWNIHFNKWQEYVLNNIKSKAKERFNIDL